MWQPHPPNFENLYNFLRCSNDVKIDISTGLYFQRSVWEWSVHICSCPWVDLPSTISFMYYVIQTMCNRHSLEFLIFPKSLYAFQFAYVCFFFQLTHFSVFLGPFFLVCCSSMTHNGFANFKSRKEKKGWYIYHEIISDKVQPVLGSCIFFRSFKNQIRST